MSAVVVSDSAVLSSRTESSKRAAEVDCSAESISQRRRAAMVPDPVGVCSPRVAHQRSTNRAHGGVSDKTLSAATVHEGSFEMPNKRGRNPNASAT